ncbi:putative nuclease HARBI1, partial [Bombyx mandarina]|uniref:Nuclease HARBI1 n=1 Tax=Bombyx mandarina TaxID=7092 RepID=A0A6J2KKK6_BOMMA
KSNIVYYSRKHFHSLNVQMICDSDCRILNVNAKYGGATHDAFIWEKIASTNCINIQSSSMARTRVAIENTFGRLKNRWRCLCKDRTLHYAPVKCAKIITACCVLHNLAIEFNIPEPEPAEIENPNLAMTISEHIFQENTIGDGLIRGRAIRSILVDKINRLHT